MAIETKIEAAPSSTSANPDNKPSQLTRGLGGWAATAIVVGTMIGTGIFLVPSAMARDAGSVGVVFAAWIAAGLLTLCGALAWAELGAALPEAGGGYAYLKRGFGPVWGFLFGWMNSVVNKPVSIAAIAAGLLRFLGFLIPALATPIFTWSLSLPFRETPYEFVFTWAQPLAVVAIALITFINYLGVRLGGQVQVVLTLLKIAGVMAIVIFGFALGEGSAANFQPLFSGSTNGALSGFLLTLVAALWAYEGWADLTLAGSEVKNPQRAIPRALVGGVALVMGIYLLANFVYFYVLPFDAVAQSQSVASDVVEKFGGRGAAQWITIAMIISALGTLNSGILTGARAPYAMARDGLFFRATASVSPRFHTPGVALVFQAALASALALTGTFDELIAMSVFAQWVYYALTIAALFGLRRKEPNLPRPYRVVGYPWIPALFIIGALALTVNLFIAMPERTSLGLGLMLFGLVFYRRWRKTLMTNPH